MQSTQLVCPHCGSTLTFGLKIAAGAAVQCLICKRAFKATNPLAVAVAALPNPIPKAAPAPKAKRPSESIQTAKPTKPSKPTPTVRPPVESGPNIALIAVTIGLLVLLTGGIGYALWQGGVFTPTGPDETDGTQLAKNDGSIVPKDPKIIPAEKKNDGGGKPLANNDDDDEDIRAKLQEELKQVLKRKVPSKVGSNDPEWEAGGPSDPPPAIVGLEQKKINLAIERGIAHLKKTQDAKGTWEGGHDVGRAALGGLTLLECKVPAGDANIQRAAALVRSVCANLVDTYDIALAVLFLDRLGDPRDRAVIHGLALRIMYAQEIDGAWGYSYPLSSPQQMYELFSYMRPKNHKFDPGENPKNPRAANDPFGQLNQLLVTNPAPDIQLEMLDPKLRSRPIIQFKGKRKGDLVLGSTGQHTDNSNTQFALLALWAARRHGIPTDQAILASYKRFVGTQHLTNHGWGYPGESTNTMTCVGLLGLGLGHGAFPEIKGVDPNDPKAVVITPALQDARIQNALQTLAKNIGQPSVDAKKTDFPMENLYFLWSVERVAMIYDLRTIGGKDWYGWGAQSLVHNQRPDGSWQGALYTGSNPPTDTCFALLFLKRSNLVQDLTNNLRLNTGIRDPG